jgi:hypothetical protein
VNGEEDDEGTPTELLLGSELREDGVEEIRRFFVGDGPSEKREVSAGLEIGGDADGVTRGKRGCGFRDCALNGALDGRVKASYGTDELIVRDDEERPDAGCGRAWLV